MQALVIFYSGKEITNLTKALIANQLVNSGVNVNTIDMTEFNSEELAEMAVKGTSKTLVVEEPVISKSSIKFDEELTEIDHACTYVTKKFGDTFSNRHHINGRAFIIECLKALNAGNDTEKTIIRNALKIISDHTVEEANERGIPSSIYRTILQLTDHNLI